MSSWPKNRLHRFSRGSYDMSGIGPRNAGHGITGALFRFLDSIIAPPPSADPVIFRRGLQVFLRDDRR